MQRQEQRSQVDHPGYPKLDLPEAEGRDWLGWTAWVIAVAGLVILVIAIAVVMGS